MKDLDVLMDKIIVDPSTGCWNWQRSTREGYGQLTIDGYPWTAHRYAYTVAKGSIPKGSLVRHTCNNRLCCNPDHLTIGTHLDNWHDSHKEYHEGYAERWIPIEVGDGSFPNIFPNYRVARDVTGLPMATLVKYNRDGVFDIELYRSSCMRKGLVPKV